MSNQFQPKFICSLCAETFGRKDPDPNAAWHHGSCDVCDDEDVMVTDVRTVSGLLDTYKEA